MMNTEEIKRLIPHRFPFLLLDKVIEYKNGDYIKAIKCISYNENFFRGHFPERPIFPGALITESLAQTSCVLFSKTIRPNKKAFFYITNLKIRFLNPVYPGDILELFSKSIKMVKTGAIFSIKATVNNHIVATGEMVFACKLLKEEL